MVRDYNLGMRRALFYPCEWKEKDMQHRDFPTEPTATMCKPCDGYELICAYYRADPILVERETKRVRK